jgi:methylisocitrate lyase
MQSAIDRGCACVDAGADMIFPEAMTKLAQYSEFVSAVNVPVLANITEFGATPLFTIQQLSDAGVSIALYPLSAFRAANKAALNVFQTLRQQGTQQSVLDTMQTRDELYQFLGYHEVEDKLNKLFAKNKSEDDDS